MTGVVTLEGAAIPRGMVRFIPDQGGAPGYGAIQAGGKYTIKTGREEGLASGAYTVTVVANEPSTPSEHASGPPTPGDPLSPPWYRDADTSPLKEIVEPGENEINLALEESPPPGWRPPQGRR